MKSWTFILVVLILAACSKPGDHSSFQKKGLFARQHPVQVLEGKASWYGPRFHGRLTANGERYDMFNMTAAHKSLPFNSWLVVTNLANDKQSVVRINDRGPYIPGRILDLSFEAARRLDMVGSGVSRVKIQVYPPTTLPQELYVLAFGRNFGETGRGRRR